MLKGCYHFHQRQSRVVTWAKYLRGQIGENRLPLSLPFRAQIFIGEENDFVGGALPLSPLSLYGPVSKRLLHGFFVKSLLGGRGGCSKTLE